jgi:hypothetical protein
VSYHHAAGLLAPSHANAECTLERPCRQLCSAVMGAFVKELTRSYERRAKRLLGLSTVADAHTGSVIVIQRFDSEAECSWAHPSARWAV